MSERVGRLRADVLRVIKGLEDPRHDGSRVFTSFARDILADLKRHHGWKDGDFPETLYRALDKAIQYHRRAGRIGYDTQDGWSISRAAWLAAQ
jgi:hypothetical protein